MAYFSLKVLDKDDNTICVSSGEDFVDLVCTRAYEEGDRIVLETSEKDIHVNWQVDDALGRAFVYITDNVSYYIPFGEKRISYSPKVFPAAGIICMWKKPGRMRLPHTATWR